MCQENSTIPTLRDMCQENSTIPTLRDMCQENSTIPTLRDMCQENSTIPTLRDMCQENSHSSLICLASIQGLVSSASIPFQDLPERLWAFPVVAFGAPKPSGGLRGLGGLSGPLVPSFSRFDLTGFKSASVRLRGPPAGLRGASGRLRGASGRLRGASGDMCLGGISGALPTFGDMGSGKWDFQL